MGVCSLSISGLARIAKEDPKTFGIIVIFLVVLLIMGTVANKLRDKATGAKPEFGISRGIVLKYGILGLCLLVILFVPNETVKIVAVILLLIIKLLLGTILKNKAYEEEQGWIQNERDKSGMSDEDNKF